MIGAGAGLTPLTTAALKQLLRATWKGEVTFPLDIAELTRHGLQYCATDVLHALRGLDQSAVQHTLVNVLAERRAMAMGTHKNIR